MALVDLTHAPHGGTHKLLPEWNSQTPITPVGLVFHTIVGSASGAWWYFHDSTGTESTFILPKSGEIWQCMSTDRVSDAQLNGNVWKGSDGKYYGFLSIETEDNGDPAHDPWTQEQIDSMLWLQDLLAKHYGWPRRQTRAPYGVDAGGIGYHAQWGLNTTTNKSVNPWTSAVGKPCPGTARIQQYKQTLLPRYTNPQEDDVTPEEVQDAVRQVLMERRKTGQPTPYEALEVIDDVNAKLDALTKKFDAFVAKFTTTN